MSCLFLSCSMSFFFIILCVARRRRFTSAPSATRPSRCTACSFRAGTSSPWNAPTGWSRRATFASPRSRRFERSWPPRRPCTFVGCAYEGTSPKMSSPRWSRRTGGSAARGSGRRPKPSREGGEEEKGEGGVCFGGAFGGPGPTEVCPRKGVYTLPVQQEDVTNFGTNVNYMYVKTSTL